MTSGAPWGAYTRTILRFGDGALAIDLREPVSEAARHRLASLGLAGPFAVITAANPRGTILDPAENAARDAAFTAEIAGQQCHRLRVTGVAVDESHAEIGWALAVPREVAVAVARRWEQLAVYWWDGARFWIVPVRIRAAHGPPLRLPGA